MKNYYHWVEDKDDSISDKRIQNFLCRLPEATLKAIQHPLFNDSEDLAHEFQKDKALRFYMDESYLAIYSLESYRDLYVWKKSSGEEGDRRELILMAQNRIYIEDSTGLPTHVKDNLLKAFLKLEKLLQQ